MTLVVGRSARSAVMNFLSEIALEFPDAISFASGRPAEELFDLDGWIASLADYRRRFAALEGMEDYQASRRFAQYGRTAGLINDLISAHLRNDHLLTCPAERIIVTSGCQEAIALCLQALCKSAEDVVLAMNPTYIGLTGAADFCGISLIPVNADRDEDRALAVLRALEGVLAARLRPRALYVVPDFDNPTGIVLSSAERSALVEICADHGVVILEDNPYGMFRFEGDEVPTMASFDRSGCVLYLGTFSKTLCPSLRVGFVALPATLFGEKNAVENLRVEIGERKSFLTVNTSQLNQAIVGGVLLKEGLTLQPLVKPATALYRKNRDVMIHALQRRLGSASGDVNWNHPEGGFFISLRLPFSFRRKEVLECARSAKVLVSPMSFFALDESHDKSIRLSFSNVSVDEIAEGVRRFGTFVENRMRSAPIVA
ncbi:MAG: PLP-dependent aminotransferase family protein [Candidatus Cybelea sp.]